MVSLIPIVVLSQYNHYGKIKFEHEPKAYNNCEYAKTYYDSLHEPRFLYCYDDNGNFNRMFDLKELKFLKNNYQAEEVYFDSNDSGFVSIVIDNKRGVVDFQGNVVLPFEYDSIGTMYKWERESKERTGFVKQNGKYGLINNNFKIVAPIQYDNVDIKRYNEVIVVENENKYGVLDKNHNLIIPIKYDNLKLISGKYFMVELDNKKGIVNFFDEVFVPLEYDSIINFYNSDVFMVKKNNSFKLLNIENKVVADNLEELHCLNAKTSYGSDYNFTYKIKNKYGLLNSERFLTSEISDSIIEEVFHTKGSKQVYLYNKDGKSGVLNKFGEIVIPAIFDEINSFKNDDASFEKIKHFSFDSLFQHRDKMTTLSLEDYSYLYYSSNFLELKVGNHTDTVNLLYKGNGFIQFIPVTKRLANSSCLTRTKVNKEAFQIDTILPFLKNNSRVEYQGDEYFIVNFKNDSLGSYLIDTLGNRSILDFNRVRSVKIRNCDSDLFYCYDNDKVAIFSAKGNKLITPFYPCLSYLNKEMYFAGMSCEEGRVFDFSHNAIIDSAFNIKMIEVIYQSFNGFKFKKDDFIYNSKADSIPAPKRPLAKKKNTINWFAQNGRIGIKKEGKILVEPIYDDIDILMGSIYKCWRWEEKVNLFDLDGNPLHEKEYESVDLIDDNLIVKINGKYNVLDRDLEYLYEEWYDRITPAWRTGFRTDEKNDPKLYRLFNGRENIYSLHIDSNVKLFKGRIERFRLLTNSIYLLKMIDEPARIFNIDHKLIYESLEEDLEFDNYGSDIILISQKRGGLGSIGILHKNGKWLENANYDGGQIKEIVQGNKIAWIGPSCTTIYEESGQKLLVYSNIKDREINKFGVHGSLMFYKTQKGEYTIQAKDGTVVIPPQKHCIEYIGNNFFKIGDCGYYGLSSILRITEINTD